MSTLELGTYVIELSVREVDHQSNGPDSGAPTTEILAAYARDLEQKIRDGYRGRLEVAACRVISEGGAL